MNPRIQGVLTPWKPGSRASGRGRPRQPSGAAVRGSRPGQAVRAGAPGAGRPGRGIRDGVGSAFG